MADVREERPQAPSAGPGLIVRIVAGPAAGREIKLGSDALVLGRVGSAVPGLDDDHELSRSHARISRFDGRVLLEDLGSTNGTFVNGEPVAGPTVVGSGDVVWMGNTTLLVQGADEGLPSVPPAEPPPPSPEGSRLRWIDLFGYPQVWGLMAAKLLTDSVWYFLLFWLPKYLFDAHHFDIKQAGSVGWIPYAASGIGCLCGGGLSSALLLSCAAVGF